MPYVGDSKRALDEYTSEIFMGGKNTISMHNTCEDSLLASPLIFDLVIMAELCERIQVHLPASLHFCQWVVDCGSATWLPLVSQVRLFMLFRILN